jgi:hypothetical protein
LHGQKLRYELPQFQGGVNEKVVIFITYGFWNSKLEKLFKYFETNINTVFSFTAKCILAGMKKSRLEGFLLAKHKAHKHPHHDEPFPPPAARF